MNVRIGTSVEGRPIEAYIRDPLLRPTILVLGGFHGDEPKSVTVARRLIDLLEAEPETCSGVRWVVVPIVNPDGYERRRRRNANLVDINRNFPTRNWARTSRRSRMFGGNRSASEPETRTVMRVISRYQPSRIVSIHSIGNARHCNNYDGPGKTLATAMSRINGYPVTASIGYPTPGSLGTWAGTDRRIATVTLELPSCHSPRRCWEDNGAALLACASRQARP